MDTCKPTKRGQTKAVIDQLREEITQGKFRVGELIGTEQGYVRDIGLSRQSIRKVVNTLVDEGLIERRPGKGLFMKNPDKPTTVMQVIIPDITFPLYSTIAQGAHGYGCTKGAEIHTYDVHSSTEQAIEIIKALPHNSNVAGALIASFHHPTFAELVFQLKMAKFPFVLIDEQLNDVQVPSIVSDNYQGAYELGQALTKLGHKRIAFIGPVKHRTVEKRLEGLRDALSDAGHVFDRTLTKDLGHLQINNGTTEKVTGDATHALMAMSNPPTAIFYSCDLLALMGHKALSQLGLSVPGDVSIVGFDGDPLGQYAGIKLTTMKQQTRRIGELAAELLLNRIGGRCADDEEFWATQIVVPTEFVRGNTIGPI